MSWISLLLAGFQVIIVGRFWVIPEAPLKAKAIIIQRNHMLLGILRLCAPVPPQQEKRSRDKQQHQEFA